MNITLIKAQYKEQHKIINFILKTNYGTYEFPIDKKLEIDWNWNDYSLLARTEKAEIETFIKQYLFSKLLEVVK